MGAVTAAKLADYAKTALTRLWSDSQIVLHWLASNKPLSQFITNRVQTINSLFPNSAWGYCPTIDNLADLLTRGINARQFIFSMLWKHGPTWLTCESEMA